MQLDIKYVFLMTVFSVIVVYGKIQVLRPQVGDPKLEHFAQLHSEETATSKQNEELPNGRDQGKDDSYTHSTHLKRLYRDVQNSAQQSFQMSTLYQLISVPKNIPEGFWLDSRGRLRRIY
ncbi:hypothetical protein WA026_012337 [Henosepilachna vigintioctopunctata]|uniref:Uncharacterized protein n=1 Tax=Henosepilachna vigintioctopunctata TaxID=420089 RepID=A0AAW1USU7_9CUCU